MPTTDLTLVLPLKGRPLFTLRYLWYANQCSLPYRILIADGEVREPLASLIEGGQMFPNLDIEYVRYPDDASFTQFYNKMADAMRRVRTPYAMMTDNDDFVVPSGIARSLDFLKANSDHVSCGGGVAGFSVLPNGNEQTEHLTGAFDHIAYRYSNNYRSRDMDSDSVFYRVLDGYRNYITTYYNIFRTSALRTIHEECAAIDFTDLELHESYFAMRALTLGKIASRADSISYFRQYGTSMGSAFKVDWVHHLLRSRFTSDFTTMVDRIAAVVSDADGSDPALIAEEIRNIFGDGLRISLGRRYANQSRGAKLHEHLRQMLPSGLRNLLRRARRPSERARNHLFNLLKGGGSDPAYVSAFREELARIEDILTGSDFSDVVRSLASVTATRGTDR